VSSNISLVISSIAVSSSSEVTSSNNSSLSVASSSVLTASSNITTTSSSSEPDTDNVPSSVENLGPNNGDGNQDGIQDSLQSNVASLPDAVTGKYVTIAIDPTSPCQTLTKVGVNTETQNIKLDDLYDYPVGFVHFESQCATSVKVKMLWYGLDPTKTFVNRKFVDPTKVYDTTTGIAAGFVDVTPTERVITYSYEVFDNRAMDEDPAIGNIKDPIGPAVLNNLASIGGTITILNQASNSSNLSQISSIIATSISSPSQILTPIFQSLINQVEPGQNSNVQPTNQTSNISTIRTGGDSETYLGVILITFGFCLLLSIGGQTMNSQLPKNQKYIIL
jgi:hypothetical protein